MYQGHQPQVVGRGGGAGASCALSSLVQSMPPGPLPRAAGGPGLIPGGFGSGTRVAPSGVRETTGYGSRRLAEHGTSPGGRLHTRYPDQGTHTCPDCGQLAVRVYAKDSLLVCRHCLEVREGIDLILRGAR